MTNRYYTRTFVGMAVVFAALAAGAVLANSIAGEAKARYHRVVAAAQSVNDKTANQKERAERIRATIGPVREFSLAWRPLAKLADKDAAERIRSDIENIAQRQLGLVTDNAITPQPERYTFQGAPVRVQKVTLRASGKDLAALLTWLGKVEERYPAAVVEWCEFSSNVGGSTGLTLRLIQPLLEIPPQRLAVAPTVQELASLPDAIASIPWPRYLPGKVKAAGPVGFQRNPLQPAVISDQRPVAMPRDQSDEITPRVQSALEGRVRSVIRGASPIVVIDGRVFRVGDEVFVGRGREKLIPEAKAKLKLIGDERLVLQMSGGSVERPIQCDVAYDLPSFLKAR